MTNVLTIAYWRDVPLSEVPRDELEREFCNAHEEIAKLRTEICERSIARIHDIAAMRRKQMRDSRGLIARVFDAIQL